MGHKRVFREVAVTFDLQNRLFLCQMSSNPLSVPETRSGDGHPADFVISGHGTEA